MDSGLRVLAVVDNYADSLMMRKLRGMGVRAKRTNKSLWVRLFPTDRRKDCKNFKIPEIIMHNSTMFVEGVEKTGRKHDKTFGVVVCGLKSGRALRPYHLDYQHRREGEKMSFAAPIALATVRWSNLNSRISIQHHRVTTSEKRARISSTEVWSGTMEALQKSPYAFYLPAAQAARDKADGKELAYAAH